MEIAVVRHQVEEKDQETFLVEHDVVTVEDLWKALKSKMDLNSEFSLGFVHPKSSALSDLGVTEGSVVRISDWVGDILTSINDPENAFQLPEAEHEKVFSEDVKWFDVCGLINQAEYDNVDTQMKILNSQIKIRVLFGHATIASPAAAFAVLRAPPPPPTKWVYGIDINVNASATLGELRSELRREGRLPLPTRFKFFTLGHKELGEDLNLKGNGISDGDVLILCQLREWHLKVSLPSESLELDFDPHLNVLELKKLLCLDDSTGGRWLSTLPSFSITCRGQVLDDSCSLEAQISEVNGKKLIIPF